ncbi:hypothetical protein EB796_023691 [Bugula neritina]|uniref:Uncharacterized protein n=1 Tax=Bugula neritina TaxID=10212 RepID=A0A7J7IVZ4_BUGNE|nr:hypothetical protein EB796_023691 [Bugula neritina]
MNMQRQMQEMALNQPDPAPDQTAEVNRLNTQIQLLQIENTETHEKLQLAENSVQAVQESLKLSAQEQKTLANTIAAEQEKYKLIAEQLAQEKTRNSTLQDEFKQTSGQLRKTEVAFEQLKSSAGRADEMQAKLSGKEELCRSLEQQIIDMKQNSIKYDSEISQLKKSLDAKDDTVARASAMHNEMKNAMESKVQSMEALIQEKTTSLDRILSENEQLQHKTQTLESRLSAIQTELTESTKKYDELHQNFVQKIDAGEGANVIVTQLKEDNARIQEKLKHAEEKAISEKEENYQKLKAVEALHKESNQITAKLTAEKQELCANVSQLETRISDLQEEHKKQTEALHMQCIMTSKVYVG